MFLVSVLYCCCTRIPPGGRCVFPTYRTCQTGLAVAVPALTRVIKSVVTAQAPDTLEWMNTPEKKTDNTYQTS